MFDLSLFAESPTNDQRFTTYVSEEQDQSEPPPLPVEYRRREPAYHTNKPLPPLPSRRVCPGYSVPRGYEIDPDSRCILQRIKRTVTPPTTRDNTLLQRRNPHSAPQLTLSVPSSNSRNRAPASAMVWMPDEQMWLIAGEAQREATPTQTAYPSPPTYNSRDCPRSEPRPTVQPRVDLTPPLTPLQSQLMSLYEPRDEERLSPLFQEAMNSVPMMDAMDLFSPPLEPLSAPISRPRRSHTSPEDSSYGLSPQTPTDWHVPARSISMNSGLSQPRSNTSSRSYHSARESLAEDLTQHMHSARRWQGLARRIARPSSAR